MSAPDPPFNNSTSRDAYPHAGLTSVDCPQGTAAGSHGGYPSQQTGVDSLPYNMANPDFSLYSDYQNPWLASSSANGDSITGNFGFPQLQTTDLYGSQYPGYHDQTENGLNDYDSVYKFLMESDDTFMDFDYPALGSTLPDVQPLTTEPTATIPKEVESGVMLDTEHLRREAAPCPNLPDHVVNTAATDQKVGNVSKSDKKKQKLTRGTKVSPPLGSVEPGTTPTIFLTEKLRRKKVTETYSTLKNIIPPSTKMDRASIIQETVCYIKSLKLKVEELHNVKEESVKLSREREIAEARKDGRPYEEIAELECQWLEKTSPRGTQVEIRKIQDEFQIRVVQRQMPGFFLGRLFSVLETKLRLEILNGSGGVIDGHEVYSFQLKELSNHPCPITIETVTQILDSLDAVFEN